MHTFIILKVLVSNLKDVGIDCVVTIGVGSGSCWGSSSWGVYNKVKI